MPRIHRQFSVRQFFFFAVDGEIKFVAVREHVIDGEQPPTPLTSFNINDLFFVFHQGVRLEHPLAFEKVRVIARVAHQPCGIGIVNFFPPQRKKQDAIRLPGSRADSILVLKASAFWFCVSSVNHNSA